MTMKFAKNISHMVFSLPLEMLLYMLKNETLNLI